MHKAKKDVAQFFRIFPEMGKKGPKWVENRVFLEFLEKKLIFAGINHKWKILFVPTFLCKYYNQGSSDSTVIGHHLIR